MNSSIGEFSRAAQRLSKNPLGIIALFIVLVYGIAALVLGVSSGTLQSNEKLPLIYFLVFFPVLVLITFYQLVAKHHVKLYAPLDYQDKEGFFRALSPLEQKQKLEQEIENIEAETQTEIKASTLGASDNLNHVEKNGILRTISIRHVYVLAEELAIREIENEFGVSVQRQIAIAKGSLFDGIFLQGGKPVLIEIKYIKTARWQIIWREQFAKFSEITKEMKPEPSFLFVVVTDGLNIKEIEIKMEKMAAEAVVPMKIRCYDFAELKEKYGITDPGEVSRVPPVKK